jgi:hypothetical protein
MKKWENIEKNLNGEKNEAKRNVHTLSDGQAGRESKGMWR